MFDEITFNQAMLSQLVRTSTNTVSRLVAQLQLVPTNQDTSHNKRYSLEQSRIITEMLYASHHRPIRNKVQAFYNFKGGTGKTSLCYQVATHLCALGFRVLALDLDPQGHLTSIMRVPEDHSFRTIYDVVINGLPIEEALMPIMPGLDLLPSNISMTRIELPLNSKTKREEKLKAIIDPLRDAYDYILIDTNPTISTLNMNALVASDTINVICETQPFSLSGLHILMSQMAQFFDDMDLTPQFCILPNKYEVKTAIAQEVLGALRAEYGQKVISAVVRKSEDINAASKRKLPISAFCRPKSTSFEDVMDLVHEIVRLSGSGEVV